MEAKENYDATNAAIVDAGNFPTPNLTDTYMLGHSFDAVNRELVYAAIISRPEVGGDVINDSGFTLWDGLNAIAPSDPIGFQDENWNFWLARKNIDTGVVTFYEAYNAANLVPAGIGGGDGTWRRYVSDTSASGGNTPILTDPRTGNAWVRMQSCDLYLFRRSDDYSHIISALRPTGNVNNAVVPAGINDTWTFAIEIANFSPQDRANVYMIPREVTAAETAADNLLAYATFPLGAEWYASFGYKWCSAVDDAGDMWLLSNNDQGVGNFKLWKFTQPSAFVYPTPPVDGGVTDKTDWTSTTGPNLGSVAGDTTSLNNASNQNRSFLCFDAGRTVLQCLSTLPISRVVSVPDDLAQSSITHTWFNTGDETWGSTIIAQGYMTADFQMTGDFTEAAFAIDGYVIPTNPYLDKDNFYDADKYGFRWFFVRVCSVNTGTGAINVNDKRFVLVKMTWNAAGPPTITPFYDEALTWDPVYPDYATAIGKDQIIQASTQVFGKVEAYVFDPANNAFWVNALQASAGGGDNFFLFDPAFAARQVRNYACPPIMLLSFTAAPLGTRRRGQIGIHYGQT